MDHVAALKAAGFSVIFVTNSGRLRREALFALQSLCAGIIIRRNIGYDFGAMREVIEHLDLPRADTEMLLLVNDSVYGPLRPLDDILARMDFNQADVWGLTESWQRRYHLQSFFLAFGRTALTDPAFRNFWRKVRPVTSKWWVISRYEIGLTQAMVKAGLRVEAVWRYSDLVRRVPPLGGIQAEMEPEADAEAKAYPGMLDPMVKSRLTHRQYIRTASSKRTPLNPTSDLWRDLLESGFPFIKRELLQRNPGEVADIAEWREVVRQTGSTAAEWIERDLKRVMRNRAP
ncbi:lipopolysaccharide biosynthesis protein [Rhodovastum atsumiense]|uniref:Lipopolysaccharide biosynthesis protein n=1 Tax=Rhodovastum atsumiense TaxID=504468 RepID=A0A5M6IWA6_9PROT|nr:lipopolysaccharide biosynthesis protein [Rhodovastum atsumiense]